jgi:hypothetical protein
LAAPDTPEVDPATLVLRDQKREEERARGRQLCDEIMARAAQQDAEWWARYDAYLTSDKWRALRQLVFKRTMAFAKAAMQLQQRKSTILVTRTWATNFFGS